MKTSQFGRAIIKARALFFGGLTWGTRNAQADAVEQILDHTVADGINLVDTTESSHR